MKNESNNILFKENTLEVIEFLESAVNHRKNYMEMMLDDINIVKSDIIINIYTSLSLKFKFIKKYFKDKKNIKDNRILLEQSFKYEEFYYLIIACNYIINKLDEVGERSGFEEISVISDRYEKILNLLIDTEEIEEEMDYELTFEDKQDKIAFHNVFLEQ